MKLEEIEVRLSAIKTEIDVEGADLDALTTEVNTLKEARKAILDKAEQRKALISEVANMPNATIVKEFNEPEARKMEERFNVETLEYRNAFLKKLQGKDLSVEERTAVTASAAIPTQTMNKIIEKMEYIAPIISKVDLSYIASNLSIPVEDTINDASWVAMGTASTDSADTLTSVTLAAYKLIKTVEIGADVSVMAIDAFESYLVNRLAKKMAKAIENAIINGTGSSQPTGLLKSGLITNTGTFTKAAMTYADLLAIIADLPDHGYRVGATLVMPSALFYSDVLPALTDKGSGLDVQAVTQMKVLGYEVILCDRVAADTIVFGNLENYAFNFAAGVAIESDKSVGFRTGSTVYRAMALADGKVTNIAAFNVYTRAAV